MLKKLAIILGIRPDVIRASLVLEKLRAQKEHEIIFIWSGQHYSDNLKDVFFRDLNVAPPEIELNVKGDNDAQVVSSVISKLSPVLEKIKPEATVFLGDTNTVMGCIVAAQQNIPIVHIEGCMRSYDWRMPEEKYRSVIDHLSDVIYAYFPEYKQQGIDEGLNPDGIVVTANPIVDVLNKYYFNVKGKFDKMAVPGFFKERGIEKNEYYLMTCHRRENVNTKGSLQNILDLIGFTDRKIYFPASYRTQKILKEYDLAMPKNVIMVDPVGYTEMLLLMVNSRGVITDSGTVVEETCVLQVPSIQMRRSTERPQVYDAGSSVKFDPAMQQNYDLKEIYLKFEELYGKKWEHNLGDGKASERIVDDLMQRLDNDTFRRHKPEDYHIKTGRSYRDDGLNSAAIELNSEYYLNHLKRTNQAICSKYSPLGLHHAHLNSFIQKWVKELPLGSSILDGGCGLSIWVTDRIRTDYNLRSMDCQTESIDFCRSYYRDNRYFLGGLYSIPLADSCMDAVVLREVLEHVKDPERAMEEIKRILKMNGRLILTTPNYSSPLLFLVENVYNRFFSELKPYLKDVHPSKFNYFSLRKLINKYFRIVEYGQIDLLNIRVVAEKVQDKGGGQ